jgi:L-ascorbate metabolism protein UlaG (beta-lactamase superfamily)
MKILNLLTCTLVYTNLIASNYNSKHDGTQFYNIKKIPNKNFFDVIKWRLNSTAIAWPKSIEDPKFPPPEAKNIPKDHVAYTLIGHASVLIQVAGLNIISDPIYSERASPVSFAGPKRVRPPAVSFDHLPHIDVVIISHDHYDHLDISTLKMLEQRDKPLFLVGLKNLSLLKSIGLSNVIELDWWQSHTHKEVEFHFTPAQHFSGRGLFDRMETLWGSYVIKTKKFKIYFAGDTGYGPHFSAIREKFGPMDLSFIPIGAYAPRWFMAPVHTNPEEALQAHDELESRMSIGIHYATFSGLTDEGIYEPEMKILSLREKRNFDIAAFGKQNTFAPKQRQYPKFAPSPL